MGKVWTTGRLLGWSVGLTAALGASFLILWASTSPEPVAGSNPATEREAVKSDHELIRAAIDNMTRPLDGRPCEMISDVAIVTTFEGAFDTLAYTVTLVADSSRIYYDSEPAKYYQHRDVGVMVSGLLQRVVLFDPRTPERVAMEQGLLEKRLAMLFGTDAHVQSVGRYPSEAGEYLLVLPVSDVGRALVGDSLRVWLDSEGALDQMDVTYPEGSKVTHILVDYLSTQPVDPTDERLATRPLDRVFQGNGSLREEYSGYRFVDHRRPITGSDREENEPDQVVGE